MSTRNYNFALLTCSFIQRSTHSFLSAQLAEHLIPILQSLRFESSRKLTQNFFLSLSCKNILWRYWIQWGLNPHELRSTQISSSSAQAVKQMAKFQGVRFESLWLLTQLFLFLSSFSSPLYTFFLYIFFLYLCKSFINFSMNVFWQQNRWIWG